MELGTNHVRILKMLETFSKPVSESRLLIEVKGKYHCSKPAKYDIAFEELVEADVIAVHPETKIVSINEVKEADPEVMDEINEILAS